MANPPFHPAQPASVLPLFPVPPPLPPPRRGRLGWLGHLFFLTAYLLALAFLGHSRTALNGRPRVAMGSVQGVLWGTAVNALLFGVVFAAAWWCSRATAAEWRLRWRGGVGPLWRGVLYSVALRIAVLVVTVAVVLGLIALHVIDADFVKQFRPHVENAISLTALAHDRAFFWCVVTLLSASAGLLEETWRGGMLAGLAGVFPRAFGGPVGSWLAIVPVAILFGLGHLYMGWGAVALTSLLGLLLGAITVWHRTIWDAAVAHALFDSGSFVLLALTFQQNPHLFGQ